MVLRIEPGPPRTHPSVEGLDVSGSEWRLDIDRYREFIEAATGITPTENLSATECYRIGNRLQALVEDRKRHGQWDQSLVEEYPDVESLAEFIWLARFFRRCHECHVEVAGTQ